jgi:hypothetical protein
MKAEWNISGGRWIGLFVGLVMGGTLFAQTGNVSPQAPGSSTTLQTYQQELRALAHERQALVAGGATQGQMQAWRQQKAPQFQALLQLMQSLGQGPALHPLPVKRAVNIPNGASQTLTDYLMAQASLANAHAQIRNELLQGLPQNASHEQITAMMQQVRKIFQQQYAGDLHGQAQRAQALGARLSSTPFRVPGPPVIPANSTPQLTAYLTARNALGRDRAQLLNQYLTATPTERQAAMEQWRQENASRFEQLRALADDLSGPIPTQEGELQ